MMLDDVIGSTIELKKRMTLTIPWDMKPASDESIDIEKAEFVTSVLNNMRFSFDSIIDNMLDGMVYGNKVGEKIYISRDNKWVWDNIKIKHSKLFDYGYGDNGNLEKLYIGKNQGGNEVVEGAERIFEKFIIMVNPYPIDGNWYGRSDLQNIYTQYYQKLYIYKWRGMYLQGYGMPVPIVKYAKSEVSDAEYNKFRELLDNWQDNMYLMLPSKRREEDGELLSKFDIEFRTVNGNKETPYDATISQLNTDMRRKLLVPDKVGYTESDGGSYALGEVQFDMLKMIIHDSHNRIENLINPHIKQLVDYNYPQTEEYPELKYMEIGEKLEQEVLKLLLENKIVSPHEKWIRTKLNIPEITDKEQMEIERIEEEQLKKNIEKRDAFMPEKGEEEKDNNTEKKEEQFKLFKTNKHPADFAKIEDDYDREETSFVKDYNRIMRTEDDRIVRNIQRRKLIENKDLKGMRQLKIMKPELKQLLTSYYIKMYMLGKVSGIDEIGGRIEVAKAKELLKNFKPTKFQLAADDLRWLDRSWIDEFLADQGALGALTADDRVYLTQLRDQAFFITGETEQRIVKESFYTVKNGLDSGLPAKQIISNLEQTLSADRKKHATTIARTNASDAFNNGRFNLFRSDNVRPFIEAYQYLAILDNVTTDFCESHSEQIIKADDPLLSLINPPNHFNCRSIISPIIIGENEQKGNQFYDYDDRYSKWGSDVPTDSQLPAKGFGGRQ